MISRKLSIIVIPVIGLALLTRGMARANLVTNGDFALYTGTAPKDFTSNCLPTDWSTGGYVYLDAPGTAVTGPGIQVWGPFPAPPRAAISSSQTAVRAWRSPSTRRSLA